MSKLVIPCPKCQSGLKLPSRKLLGKVAKCPKCQHKFRLEEPDEVELELAEEPVARDPEPAVGTSAKWIPDEPAIEAIPNVPKVPTPDVPDTNAFNFVDINADAPGPEISVDPASSSVTSRTKKGRKPKNKKRGRSSKSARKKKKSPWPMIAAAIGLIALIGGGIAFALRAGSAPEVAETKEPPKVNEEWKQQEAEKIQSSESIAAASPTSGEPISLLHVPAGTQMVIHLRPAELWQANNQFTEFRASLGQISAWIEQGIQDLTKFKPTEIKEMTLCLALGSSGEPPEASAVVHLLNVPTKRSELLQVYRSRLEAERTDHKQTVFSNGERAWYVIDDSTFVVGPHIYLDDMLSASEFTNPANTGIEALIEKTDRDRHVTVLFKPDDIAVHAKTLVAENVIPAARRFSEWFAKESETAAWSLHLGDQIFIETLLRNQSQVTVPRLERNIRARMKELPHKILAVVEKMNPQQTAYRKLIGRFPAMTKAFQMATQTGFDTRLVRMATFLPERAAPNLALGTLLTWNETNAAYFGSDVQMASNNQSAAPKLPDTVAGRLQRKIEIGFENTPLEEAVALIGEDIEVTFILDGDALKAAGYTQNLKQTMDLGTAPAIKALQAMNETKDQEKMAFVIDEANKSITVTTYTAAKDRGQTPITFK